MPACLTHYLFAKKVLEALPEGTVSDLTAYFWGAQGPDFFFCHKYLSRNKEGSVSKYGNMIHGEKPSDSLGAMRSFLEKHPDPGYRSYVLGVLCHYSLDSLTHPYINAMADRMVEERPYENRVTMHGEIESALDAITLRRETGKLPSEMPLGKMFPKKEPVQRRIARLYREVIFQLYGEDVPEEAIYRATCDATLIFTLLTDRFGLKKLVFDLVEKGKPSSISSHIVPLTENSEIDYANFQEEEWQAEGKTSTKSFYQLFEEAEGLAHTLITTFDACDIAAVTGEKPFG